MADAGRRLSVTEAVDRCRRGDGFLIEETMGGWPICRLWWVDDACFVESLDSASAMPDSKAHHLNCTRYLDPDHGIAYLVCPFRFFGGMRRLLRKRFPGISPKWIDQLHAREGAWQSDGDQ